MGLLLTTAAFINGLPYDQVPCHFFSHPDLSFVFCRCRQLRLLPPTSLSGYIGTRRQCFFSKLVPFSLCPRHYFFFSRFSTLITSGFVGLPLPVVVFTVPKPFFQAPLWTHFFFFWCNPLHLLIYTPRLPQPASRSPQLKKLTADNCPPPHFVSTRVPRAKAPFARRVSFFLSPPPHWKGAVYVVQVWQPVGVPSAPPLPSTSRSDISLRPWGRDLNSSELFHFQVYLPACFFEPYRPPGVGPLAYLTLSSLPSPREVAVKATGS